MEDNYMYNYTRVRIAADAAAAAVAVTTTAAEAGCSRLQLHIGSGAPGNTPFSSDLIHTDADNIYIYMNFI